MKIRGMFLVLAVLLAFYSFACAQTEQLVLTTYYPSPSGSYSELLLAPKPEVAADCDAAAEEGRMFYNSATHTLRVCKTIGAVTSWQDGVEGVPSGAVMHFNLTACPSGWTALASAQGRYLVGVAAGGTLAGIVGTALSNVENRAVGNHTHSINDPGHQHDLWAGERESGGITSDFDAASEWTGHMSTKIAHTNITINSTGNIAGTNAPYIQLLVCQKD